MTNEMNLIVSYADRIIKAGQLKRNEAIQKLAAQHAVRDEISSILDEIVNWGKIELDPIAILLRHISNADLTTEFNDKLYEVNRDRDYSFKFFISSAGVTYVSIALRSHWKFMLNNKGELTAHSQASDTFVPVNMEYFLREPLETRTKSVREFNALLDTAKLQFFKALDELTSGVK